MRRVEPCVFLVGETRLIVEDGEDPGLLSYLEHIGAAEWVSEDPSSDAEELIEVMGRLCYRSFDVELNPNLTKVRIGNSPYLENIARSKHGSVTEHSVINFIFADVSRVFTHELVRHRAGTAISQESMRFVRLDDLGLWLPSCIASDPWAVELYEEEFRRAEEVQKKLVQHFRIDEQTFHKKKELTSAFRRLIPDGVATAIGWSANFRALRWILQQRTDPAAEEEIRLVFSKVGEVMMRRYPHMFSDVEVVANEDGIPSYMPVNSKI